ncbi:hypothetical protein ES705_20676 [subsurface metagenome]
MFFYSQNIPFYKGDENGRTERINGKQVNCINTNFCFPSLFLCVVPIRTDERLDT